MKNFVLSIGLLLLSFEISFATESQDTIHSWENLNPTLQLESISTLPEDQKVELFESAIIYQKNIYYQTYDSTKQNKVLRLDSNSGQFTNMDWNYGKILGWVIFEKQLLVLSKNKILFLDPITFKLEKELLLKSSVSGWNDLLVEDKKIITCRGKKLTYFSLETGEKSEEKLLPFDSVQRVMRWENKSLALISSFWGNKIKIVDPENFILQKEIPFPANHRSLFKMQFLNDKHIVVADPVTKVFAEYTKFGDKYFLLNRQTQIAKDDFAIRFAPIENRFEYKFRIEAKEDVSASTVHFLLPKKSIYSQELSEEEFSKATEIESDRFENRILKLEVPALKTGEVFEHTPYKAKMVRYKVHFNFEKLNLDYQNLKVPEPITQYKENFDQLDFEDLRVVNKRKEILGDAHSVKEILEKVQNYVASIPYKSGKFESAPKVIEKNNGACTEHSYVTMAILRSLGIPARLVWNYLPTESAPTFTFNHKFVEVWLPNYGWIPMEPLAPPATVAGTTYARHVIFATMRKVELAAIPGGDRLFQLSKKDLNKSKKLKMNFEILKTNWNETEKEEPETETIKIQSRSIETKDIVTIP